MAQYGRIQRTFQDSQGRPIVGLAVTVRKQGATVNGLHSGAQTSFTVNDPGGITDSPADQLQVGTDTSVTRAVSSVAATTIVVGAGGFSNVADDARLTPTTNLPTVYNDAQGGETITQPLQTDANGSIECWAPIVPYDLYTPGIVKVYSPRLIQDVVPEGQELVVSNIFPSASSVAFQKDTLRAMVSGSKLERLLSAGVEKWYVGLQAALEPVVPAHHVIGPLTIDSGGIVITLNDLTFGAAASRIIPGATSFSVRNHANSADNLLVSDAGVATLRAGLVVAAGGATITAGDIAATASLANFKRIGATGGTAITTADITIGGNWGTTATKNVQAGSTDTRGTIYVVSSGTGQSADAAVVLTFKDGTFTTNPVVLVCVDGANTTPAALGEGWDGKPSGATAAVFNHHTAPVAGQQYGFSYIVIK